jgi:hypothetical protein
MSRVLDLAPSNQEAVHTVALWSTMPRATAIALLRHSDPSVGLACAVGLWNADQEGLAVSGPVSDWKQAVVRAEPRENGRSAADDSLRYWLGEILAAEPELALAWLRQRIEAEQIPRHIDEEGVWQRAISGLAEEQRRDLLRSLESHAAQPEIRELVRALVGRSAALYKGLLASPKLSDFHRAPLHREPDSEWPAQALLAINAGLDHRRVVTASFHGSDGWWGSGVEHWKRWETFFDEMRRSGPPDLCGVAQMGLEEARRRINKGLEEERQRALKGTW